jgi:hypothetical protein
VLALALLAAGPLRAEIISARTEHQVVEEELTVEAAIAKLRARGVATGTARAIAERMTAEDHAYFQADDRRVQPGAWLRGIIELGARVAFGA